MKVEGTSLDDPVDGALLAIDLTEYYGGNNFDSARRVVVSQLKYSTTKPNRKWTKSRLLQKNQKGTRSLIRDLAKIFEGFKGEVGRDEALKTLAIKLVSNQPLDATLKDAIKKAQISLNHRPGGTRFKTLSQSLSAGQSDLLDELRAGAKLGSIGFTDFLRILNLSDCGSASRLEQDAQLFQAIGNMTIGSPTHSSTALKALVREQMQPETDGSPPLDRDRLLFAFGVSSIDDLFPCTPDFNLPENRIERREAVKLAEKIKSSSDDPVLLRSDGGFGKTVLLHDMQDHLPESSVVVLFDSYGGGSYLNPADVRHTPRRAVVQVANELARACGSPFLPPMGEVPSEDLYRDLVKRLEKASATLRQVNPEALLVVAIDAADNSVFAAKETGKESFVVDLFKQPFPSGTRLVISYRAAHESLFDIGSNLPFEISAFTQEESGAHMRMYFPDATEDETAEFHRLTQGVPRTQGYMLENSSEGIEAVLDPLQPDGKSLPEFFHDRFQEAATKSCIAGNGEALCSALIALPRPVPMKYLSLGTGHSESSITDFVRDIGMGLRLDPETNEVSFRDQDIEDFIRERGRRSLGEITDRLTESIFDQRLADPYAARYVASFLSRTRRFDQLSDLILNEEPVDEILPSPLEQREVKTNRIQTALRLAKQQHDKADVRPRIFKFLFLAAEIRKADAMVRQLLRENRDLSAAYSDSETVDNLHRVDYESDRSAPDLYLRAAALAHFPDKKDNVITALRNAGRLVSENIRLPENDGWISDLQSEHIVAGAEAVLRTLGLEKAQRWLDSWKPEEMRYEVSQTLAKNLLQSEGEDSVREALKGVRLPAIAILPIIGAFHQCGLTPPKDLIDKSVSAWSRFNKSIGASRYPILADGVSLCEVMLRGGIEHRMIRQVLEVFRPAIEKNLHIFCDRTRQINDTVLRWKTLDGRLDGHGLIWKNFLPESLNRGAIHSEEDKERSERTHKECERVYSALIPAYELRAAALADELIPKELKKRIRVFLGDTGRGYRLLHQRGSMDLYRLIALALADTITRMVDKGAEPLLDELERYLRKERYFNHELALELAKVAISAPGLQSWASRVLAGVQQYLEDRPDVAENTVGTLLQCSRIAKRLSDSGSASKAYFNSAIKATENLGEEVCSLLPCLKTLAQERSKRGETPDPELSYSYARFAEECVNQMGDLKHFPEEEIVETLTHLDPASAFAILSRWDDRRVNAHYDAGFLQQEIFALLRVSSRTGFISPATACALVVLAKADDGGFSEFAVSILTDALKQNGRQAVLDLLNPLIRDLQLHRPVEFRKRIAAEFSKWTQENDFESVESARTISKLCQFLEPWMEEWQRSEPALPETKPAPEPNWEDLLAERDFTEPEDFTETLRVVAEDGDYHRSHQRTVLEKSTEDSPLDQRVAQLNALKSVDPEVLPLEHLLYAIEFRLTKWGDHPDIERWKEVNASIIFDQRFDELFSYDIFRGTLFHKLRNTFGMGDSVSLELVLPHLEDCIGAPSRALYHLIQETLPSLTGNESTEVAEWILSRLERTLRDNCSDGPWAECLRPSCDAADIVGSFLWKLLGHPDKRLRWRAAHAARRLISIGDTDIVSSMAKHLDIDSMGPFQDRESMFYKHSAKLWFFILLERLANESPEAVIPLKDRIKEEGLSPIIPHVLVKHFARLAALALSEANGEIYSEADLAELSRVNSSPFASIKEDEVDPSDTQPLPSKERRFPFDDMDTLPYWYSPLGSVFGIHRCGVLREAEKWICDKWGESESTIRDDRGMNEVDWGLRSNRQGHEPVVETRQHYLEWHAMFCAAGVLLEKRAVVQDEWSDNPFGKWLRSWGTEWPDRWLADLRDSTPLEDQFWSMNPPDSEGWIKDMEATDFDRAVGMQNSIRPGYLILKGGHRQAIRGSSESASISCALVSPETGFALLRSFHANENPYGYALPTEGDDSECCMPGFELTGFVSVESSNRDGIDGHDPLRNDLSGSLFLPGKDFREWGNLVASDNRKDFHRKGRETSLITALEWWSDLRRGEKSQGFYSEGARLWFQVEEVLGYLRARKKLLIVKCHISRHMDRKERGGNFPGRARNYLIHGDGQVQTVGQTFYLGQPDC